MTKKPISFKLYEQMTEKDKKVFNLALSHIYLYGCKDRDIANTLWDIIRVLIGNDDISEEEISWFMNFWHEEDESKMNRMFQK